jgi:Mg-chelatase subunit ChlD
VLDRSGSMGSIADATVDAINGFLTKQRAHPGMLRLSLADFDSQEPFRMVTDAVPVAEVIDLTEADYQPRGGTPLLDAIGRAVERIDARVGELPDEDQVLVIITDGYENASTDFSGEVVAALLDARQEAGWTVLFLGANQDSFATADVMNMRRGNVRDFEASRAGVRAAVDLASAAVIDHRSRTPVERSRTRDELFDLRDQDEGS